MVESEPSAHTERPGVADFASTLDRTTNPNSRHARVSGNVLLDDETEEHEPDPPDEPNAEDFGIKIPQPPNSDLADRDVPADLQQTFWILVLIFNAALLAASLGAMLLAFEQQWATGGALLAGGVVLFLMGWRRYRRVRKG